MKKIGKVIAVVVCFLCASQMQAQDLVYKPKNPAFGGDTFNYNWLLSSAQAQDLTAENRAKVTTQKSSVDAFASNLNNLLLSQILRQLISGQFGEDGLQDGQYTLGNFQVDVATTFQGLTITIFDQVQGQSTQIVIPFFWKYSNPIHYKPSRTHSSHTQVPPPPFLVKYRLTNGANALRSNW